MENRFFFTKLAFFLFISTLSTIFFSCNSEIDDIPVVYVDIQIDLNDPNYNNLRAIGNFVYITGGVNGIILYRKSFDEFNAFERTCPHDPDCGKVFADEINLIAKDTICCGSEFTLMINGAVSKGPSKFPLREYSTIYNKNSNILWITN